MGLPSGLLWATRNIDVTQENGFAETEFQYGCSYFSWGNIDGHNPTGATTFTPWSWGSDGTSEPYSTSPGATIEFPGRFGSQNDAAYMNLGAPWRTPTKDEMVELFGNVVFIDENDVEIDAAVANKIIEMNGTKGIRIRSVINGAVMFFPCCGFGSSSQLSVVGSNGAYWASDLFSASSGRRLGINETGVFPAGNFARFRGVPIRPVFSRRRR